MSEDVHQIILEEIGKIPGHKKFAGESVQVCCPLPSHYDNSPSCGIFVQPGMEIPLGFFHCFGCGAKGPWNELAREAGLRQIEGWKLKDADRTSVSGLGMLLNKTSNKIQTYRTLDRLMKELKRSSYIEWPAHTEWRSFPGKLVQDAGGLMNYQVFSFGNRESDGDNVCFFPCTSGKRYIGGIAAYMQKQMNGTSYLNSQGDWAKKKGLFPLNLVKDCLKKYKLKYVFLVEGPRDALALLSHGIPALAVLGAEQFSETKMIMIENLGVSHVFSMMDNDDGGTLAKKRIKDVFDKDSYIKYKAFKLPREFDAKGKLIKIDPESASLSLIKEVKGVIRRMFPKRAFIPAKKLGWKRIKK